MLLCAGIDTVDCLLVVATHVMLLGAVRDQRRHCLPADCGNSLRRCYVLASAADTAATAAATAGLCMLMAFVAAADALLPTLLLTLLLLALLLRQV